MEIGADSARSPGGDAKVVGDFYVGCHSDVVDEGEGTSHAATLPNQRVLPAPAVRPVAYSLFDQMFSKYLLRMLQSHFASSSFSQRNSLVGPLTQ